MMRRLVLMAVTGALIVALAATSALAQQGEVRGPVTATGVLGEPYTQGQDPTVQYRLTDEATGTNYVLVSGFVDLNPYVGQRVTIWGAPVGGADYAPPALNVTHIELAGQQVPPTVTPDQGVVTPDQGVVTPDQGVQVTILPDTGGLALLPIVGAMLVAGGLLGTRMLRRR